MTECKKFFKNVEILTATLLKGVSGYMIHYNISALNAFTNVVDSLYKYTKLHKWTTAERFDYTERVFKVISDNSLSFSDLELNAIYSYFGGIAISPDSKINNFKKQLKTEIAERNTYRQKLIDSTAEQRHLLHHSQLMLSDEIIKYIEYWKIFEREDAEYLLYNSLYFLGYIAGKRTERTRKKTIIAIPPNTARLTSMIK